MYASLKPLQAVTENKLDLFIDSSDGNAAEGNAADGNAAAVNWNNEKTDACFDPTSAPAARLISDNFTGGRGTSGGRLKVRNFSHVAPNIQKSVWEWTFNPRFLEHLERSATPTPGIHPPPLRSRPT